MTNDKKLTLAELNRKRTTDKVVKALEKMKNNNIPINIKSVSEIAKISRKTIYNRPDLKALIEETKSLQTDLNNFGEKKCKTIVRKSQLDQLKRLREKNKELIEEKKKLLEQNMMLTKEVLKLQNRLSDLEEKIYSNTRIRTVNNKNKNI